MARGGKRDGAGRKPGTPNKASAAKAAEVASAGVTPLDYMLGVLRDEAAEPHLRFDAAKSAAPYIHPKLAQITNTHRHSFATMSDDELERIAAGGRDR